MLKRHLGKTVQGGVVGTRCKVRQQLDPLKRPLDAKSNILSPGVKALSKGTRGIAGSNPAPAPYFPYKNKLEQNYATLLAMERQAGLIKAWAYESMTLKLAKGKYHRPDFTIWHNDKLIEVAQTKGYHKNMRASLTGLKWAAQLNPWYRFTIKRYARGEWESEEVQS